MADANSQTITLTRGEAINIVLTGTFTSSPAAWALTFTVAPNRGGTAALTVSSPAITVTGSNPYVATIPLTRANTSLLTLDEYDWDLFRTDAGSECPKAGGTLQVLTPCYPPA